MEIEISSDGSAIKKYGVAGRAKESKRSRPDITVAKVVPAVNPSAIPVASRPPRGRYIFPRWWDKCCPRGRTERCFHKAALFFLRLRPRIQFFLPLLYPSLLFGRIFSLTSPVFRSPFRFRAASPHSRRRILPSRFSLVYHLLTAPKLISFLFQSEWPNAWRGHAAAAKQLPA